MDLSQRIEFCHWLLHFFENSIWIWEPLINSWFNVPIAQIYTFMLFRSTAVSCRSIFSLWVSLIRKNSVAHMHHLAVYLKEGLTFARDESLENSQDSYSWFRLPLRHSLSYFFFFSVDHLLCLYARFLMLFHLNIHEVLSVDPSANVFTFGDFKGSVRYIFTSLFCMSKREGLWNKEKCFLFHFESSFRSWDNQILNF